ncbi:GCN5 family acetyltransferase [Methyloprofundus sedimenti]|uniref:GCN5 family acetyltransferase n=1 Tax=Methyloprofundus sedimenti TaxID=1420851 RepID=A0A1V8M401_9GAMM|nr:GNAT family N-acetyltransferase [Methyloprofundus sedimenti]OQK16216.1 GCN5 family acetyltransferase [Methyloprofundus sedimenti]
MITVPLDKNKHDRKRFDCGVEPLNNYLRLMAQQQSSKDNTRTFVLEDQQQTTFIIGYYTLTMTTLNLSALPQKLQKKHQNAQATALIARLAIDKRYAQQGYGEWLLIDALHKLLAASDTVAFPLIMVDAKQGVAKFYEKMGFSSFLDEPNKLFMTLMDVRRSLGQ